MKRLLVTGGAGFIGANFVHYWARQYPDDRLLVVDALTYAGNLESLSALRSHPQYRFIEADIRDQDRMVELLSDEKIDTLVHFAAESHVDRSITGPGEFVSTNVVGTYALLEAARACWLGDRALDAHRFHHVSTDEVYGSLGPQDAPFTEQTAYAPNSPYSASKAGADHLVRAYHHTYGLNVTTSNCSNNYGPYQLPEKLIPLMIVNALQGKPLPIYGDGGNVRDWLYVGDHVVAIDRILRAGRAGRTYNVGGNEEHANLDLARRLCRNIDTAFANDASLGKRFPDAPAAQSQATEELIAMVPDRPGHDRRYAIDASRIDAELQFRPAHDFDSGLRHTLQWMLDNESWWRAILDRLADGSYRHC